MNDGKVFFVKFNEYADLASRLVPLPGVQTVFMTHNGQGKPTAFEEFGKRLSRQGLCAANVAFGERTAYYGLGDIIKPDFLFSADECRRQTEYNEKWVVPVAGKRAWEPAKWQGGTDHEAPLKHGKNPKAVAKRRKKKKLATKR